MVAQLPLDLLEPVTGLLGHHERDVVDEPAGVQLGLAAHSHHAVLHVLPVGRATHQGSCAQRDRIEHAQPGQRGHHAEHQHTAVGPLQPDGRLAAPADRFGLELLGRLDLPEPRAHDPGADGGHLHRVHPGADERLGHLFGEHLGTLEGPHEVVPDRGGDGVLEFGADLGPHPRRITGVDHLLGVLGDGAEAATQVVFDVGGEVGDPVVENLLPQRRLCQGVLRFGLAAFQVGAQRLARGGVVERFQLGAHRETQMLCRRTDLGHHLVADAIVLAGGHLLGQEVHQRREVGLGVEFLVVGLDRVAAQHRGHRDDRHRYPGALQVPLVGGDDVTPVRVQIGLGRHDPGDRADLHRLAQERHLGFGELLAGVAGHQHRVRVGQQAQRGGQMGLTVASHPGGVDERQSALEQRAGRADLGADDPPSAGQRMEAQIGSHVGGRDVDELGFGATGTFDHDAGRGLLGVGHHGRQHRGLVVGDPGNGDVEQ